MSTDNSDNKNIVPLKEECASFAQDLEIKFKEIRGDGYDYGFGWDHAHISAILAVYLERFVKTGIGGIHSKFFTESVNYAEATPEEDERANQAQTDFYADLIKRLNAHAAGDLPDEDEGKLYLDIANNISIMWK